MLRESSIKLDKINEDKLVLSEDLVKNYYMIIFSINKEIIILEENVNLILLLGKKSSKKNSKFILCFI